MQWDMMFCSCSERLTMHNMGLIMHIRGADHAQHGGWSCKVRMYIVGGGLTIHKMWLRWDWPCTKCGCSGANHAQSVAASSGGWPCIKCDNISAYSRRQFTTLQACGELAMFEINQLSYNSAAENNCPDPYFGHLLWRWMLLFVWWRYNHSSDLNAVWWRVTHSDR